MLSPVCLRQVLATMDWSLPVRVWCIEWEQGIAPVSTNRSIAHIMSRHGYAREPWAHEDKGLHPLGQNQLWVRQDEWNPTSYRWRPWTFAQRPR